MILYPAIDLYEGRIVRLRQGDYDRLTAYGDDPVAQARLFAEAGCTWLHVVDLEGAKAGEPRHLHLLPALAETGLSIQYGGGLRDREALSSALRAGATRVMAGSLLVRDTEGAARLFDQWGEAIVAAVDVREGTVAFGGWIERSDLDPQGFLEKLLSLGARRFLVTSVARDGTGQGPDVELYRSLLAAFPAAALIAAGGVASVEDLLSLRDLGLEGAVAGRSLYEGTLSLVVALEALGRPC